MARIDPITREVIASALPAVSNEMSAALQRASYNMMIYEVRDYCCALMDRNGDLLSQNVGGVSHFTADLGVVVRDALERYGPDGFEPGDVLLTNHQRVAGQHLNNICVYTPLFYGGRLAGFPMVRAHWIDVGGVSTGFGAGARASDPWTEGLQIDQLKLYEGGRVNRGAWQLIRDNIRFPESSLGDLRAQIAACRLGERRMAELLDRYGPDVVWEAVEEIFDQTERRCRAVVERIPDGEYTAEAFMDDDGVEAGVPVPIRVRVTVAGGAMTIDLSDCSQQRKGAINSRTLAGARVAYKALTAPHDPVNEGSFRALRTIVPEGNLMMARYPAPMANWSSPLPTVVDAILRSLAPALPDRVPAAHLGVLGVSLVFFGEDPVRRRRFVVQSIEGGGWGGRPHGDGASASVSVCQGDVRNGPIEGIELRCPVVIEERAMRTDSGGPGKYRGGLGLRVQVRNLVEGKWNLWQRKRRNCPPWGLWGGLPGAVSDNLLRLPGETEWRSVDVVLHAVPADTRAAVLTPGGGGWGDPLERDPDQVWWDVTEGLVSAEAAREAYGVVLAAGGAAVDPEATARLRERLRGRRPAGGASAGHGRDGGVRTGN